MCDMTPSYVWHDSFICVTWLIHMCVTWLIHMFTWDMTQLPNIKRHATLWHDSFICVTWLLHMGDMTHSDLHESIHMWHDSIHIYMNVCVCVCVCVCVIYSHETWLNHLISNGTRLSRSTHGATSRQCVAVCCSVLQCVAVCCSVLQCVAVCCSVLQCVTTRLISKGTHMW